MKRVPVDQLQVGMALSADVLDRSGRLLLPAQTVLTERHLRALRIWGVPELPVSTGPAEELPAEPVEPKLEPDELASLEAELKQRFRHTDLGHPFVAELFRQCLARRARAAAGGRP
jgi:hypothetical protein